MKRPLARVERIAWLRLARTPGIGPISVQRLIARFGGAQAALEALPRLTRGEKTPLPVAAAEQELGALERLGARLVCLPEPDYPPLLAQLPAPPPILSIRGDISLAARPTIAIVGAREASAAGLRLARDFASQLGEAGYVIVSGLARGVDAAAHGGALATGTIAVMAGGIDRPYPQQNLPLHDAIAEQGCVVAASPLGQEARAKDFPRRNAIISGLAFGVVVIEAALRSGSLITARAALDHGRELMVVPGSPLDPRARGGNSLLKSGAGLVETAADVLDCLQSAPRRPWPTPAQPELEFEPSEPVDPALPHRLAELLSPVPVHLNDLMRAAGAPSNAVAAALMELELAGQALSLPGGYVASAPH